MSSLTLLLPGIVLGYIFVVSLLLYFDSKPFTIDNGDPRLILPSDPKDAADLIKMQMGYVKGGMYSGITFIPGDPDKPWEEGDESVFPCPACDGVLRNLYQTTEEEQDGEYIKVYKQVCKDCNFLNDTGRKMTEREIRSSQYVYCDVVKANTFNRTGHYCAFIDNSFGEIDVCQRIEPCDECPHPY